MSFFKKLFGKTPEPPRQDTSPAPQRSAEEMREDPNLIRVFDKFGRELFITKDDWRKNVLPGGIKNHWNNADELYGDILGALNDGFRTDILDAAKHLYEIDHNRERGTCIWGIVLREENRLDEAEKVFRDYLAKQGESGAILTNLAKVIADRKDDAKAEEILWHALEVDPNQENGFGWYEVIHRERGGEEAGLEATRQVAALPGSWRAQLWLARAALKKQDLAEAVSLYEESLSRAGTPTPIDLLMQISGDLGNAGQLPEIFKLVEPRFDVALHGLTVGNNLVKAHLDLSQFDEAQHILDQLYAQNRPDWKPTLSYWDTEIAKARIAASPATQKTPYKVALLTGDGPIWLKPTSPAAKLFSDKPENCARICFLGSTAETMAREVVHQLSDSPGRLSRAIPLFLAEQVEMGCCARAQTLVPWMTEPPAGFVLSGVMWSDENAVQYAQQGERKCGYAVISHLKTQVDPWTVEVRLVRVSDGACLGHHSESFPSATPTQAVLTLAQTLLDWLDREAGIKRLPTPSAYAPPDAANFPYYLLRLEQLLAVRCGAMDGVPRGFLSGAHEILEGNLDLCLQTPHSASVRLLLAQTLLAMKRCQPDILPEFAERVKSLQKDYPLIEAEQGVVQGIIDEAMAK